MRLIIDSHLDLAWNVLGWDRDLTLPLDELNAGEAGLVDSDARGRATTCWPELRKAGVAVCLATVLARVKPETPAADRQRRRSIDFGHAAAAYGFAQGQLAYYRLMETLGEIVLLRTAEELRSHWSRWQDPGEDRLPIGILLAMEGADPIVRPEQCESWWEDGLRSLSLAHYGPSPYAAGTGTTGPLTPDGRRLLAEMERVGMILDVTHLAEPGFTEALDRFGGPLMASHNNCRALVPGDRQFSDEQIRRLLGRDTVIGVALDAWMLYPGWEKGKTPHEAVRLDAVCDHVDHICQLAGDCRHAALGSDLDGGYGTEQTPEGLRSIADLQRLGEILAGRGYGDEEIDAVFHGNWLAFFERHLPS